MAQLPTQSQFGDYGEWPGRDVLDSGGQRLGGVREIYLDRETGRPEWVLVEVEGGDARFVPLADAAVESTTIRVAHSAEVIRDAPGIGAEPRIDQSEEERLYAHYGLGYSAEESGSGLPAEAPAPEPEPQPAQEPPVSSWSDAAPTNDAPPPAEPPSPEEIERAEIPEPPATTERGADDPFPTAASGDDVDDTLPASRGDDVLASAPDPYLPPAVEPEAEPILPPLTPHAAPPEAAPPEAVTPADAVPIPSPPTPPEAVDPEPAAPPPPRASSYAPPRPEPEPSAGPLAVLHTRPGSIAAAVAVAIVLLMIMRRLR
jgi:hypothetical protein